jgi:hypothetical protein
MTRTSVRESGPRDPETMLDTNVTPNNRMHRTVQQRRFAPLLFGR